MSGSYDRAESCVNGHVLTANANISAMRAPFCSQCGQPIISKCQRCQAQIRGNYDVPGVVDVRNRYKLPKYCHECGEAYPWTSRSITAANDLLDEDSKLRPEDRDVLKAALPDLLADTPRTAVSIVSARRILGKVGKETADGIKAVLMDLAVEAAKRGLWPNA